MMQGSRPVNLWTEDWEALEKWYDDAGSKLTIASLDGRILQAVYESRPTMPDTITAGGKKFYRSGDGTWRYSGSGAALDANTPLFDALNRLYELENSAD